MKLTERERGFIARRASGSYAILPAIRRIVVAHRKNRDTDDALFLEFAHLILKRSYSWDEYDRLRGAILEIIPEPWGPLVRQSELETELTPVRRVKRRRRCGLCSGEGHNARTCPSKPDTPTVTYTDGIERLSPGFDPNPPLMVEVSCDDQTIDLVLNEEAEKSLADVQSIQE